MATATVHNLILDGSGAPVIGANVTIQLSPNTAPVFDTTDGHEIEPLLIISTDATGLWSTPLSRTDQMSVAGTTWHVMERYPSGQQSSYYIAVGAGGGAANTLIVNPPAPLPSVGIVTSIVGAGGTDVTLSGGVATVTSGGDGDGYDVSLLGGASPSATAAANVTAINAALAAHAVVVISVPGTYLINDHLLIPSYTTLQLGPSVTIKKANAATNNVCMLRNANLQGSDTAITVRGGTWDGNYTNQSGAVHSDRTSALTGVQGDLSFIGVAHLVVENVTLNNVSGFAVQIIGTDFRTDNLVFGTGCQLDGLHINGPSARGVIRNISGYTPDDFIALNAWDWLGSSPSVGDITDIHIDTLRLLPPNGAAAQSSVVKLLPGTRSATQANIRRITVRDVKGENHDQAFRFFNDTDPAGPTPSGTGQISDVTVSDIRLHMTNSASVFWLGNDIQDLTIRDWQIDPTSSWGGGVLQVASYTTQKLVIDGVQMPTGTGIDNFLNVKGTITDLRLNNIQYIGVNNGSASTGSDGCFLNLNSGGAIGHISVSGLQQNYGGSFCFTQGNAASATTDISMTGCKFTTVKHIFFAQKPVTMRASACVFEAIPNDLARVDAVAFTGRFQACDATYNGGVPITNVNGATVRIQSSDMGFDVTKATLNGAANGDLVNNSNAGLACGVGPAVYNGTNWKNLYTGTTY